MSAAEAMGLEQFRATADEAEPEDMAAEEADSLASCGYGTDLDASKRLVELFGVDIRHCAEVGWLGWDGQRWKAGAEGAVTEWAKQSARAWLMRVANSTSPGKAREVSEALKMENVSRINGAVKLAETDPRIRIEHHQLDRDPWLLNVENGTVDLRTGNLRPHERGDLITKVAPVTFDPEASHWALTRFLETIRANDPEMPGLLQRICGYTLQGGTDAESLFLTQGDGGSGKTTFAEAMAAMLGEYAVKLRFESLCSSKHGRSPGAATPDLVPLRGARMAYASEGDQSARLDSGLVKELTGGEPITVRANYRDPITINPTWKAFLFSNFDPKSDSEDTGIWRRMVKMEFHAIPENLRDPTVKTSLVTDPAARSAVLAWAVRGCLDWKASGGGRKGLAIPESVKAATEEYRKKNDTLAEWWEDLTAEATTGPNERTLATRVRAHYREWCGESGARECGPTRFKEYLISKGCEVRRSNGERHVWGVALE